MIIIITGPEELLLLSAGAQSLDTSCCMKYQCSITAHTKNACKKGIRTVLVHINTLQHVRRIIHHLAGEAAVLLTVLGLQSHRTQSSTQVAGSNTLLQRAPYVSTEVASKPQKPYILTTGAAACAEPDSAVEKSCGPCSMLAAAALMHLEPLNFQFKDGPNKQASACH